MKKYFFQTFSGVICLGFLVGTALAHCEIPCGIYDDQARIDMILEHITTIEKSMNQITSISKEKSPNYNQLVRWIMNKEKHATEIQTIVSQYFLTQRIKPDTKDYHQEISLLQQMLVYAMKCKQTTDLQNTAHLKELVKQFHQLYFAGH
ncbi:MAG: superoxide dismutase, Ni [Deltaproteobacteria bacterium]|jgi:nickel superoxide dismutase|nr:superoxide dismutase, Ni [Deltaproteobacteria bacterium]